MKVLQVRNVNEALYEGLRYLSYFGITQESRFGDVVVSPEPVTTVYKQPRERVLLNPKRDANPFFHFFESLWMLAGRNDVAYMEYILPSFKQFSDDGVTFHGAYGYRWRQHFDRDQLVEIVDILQKNKRDRRAVLGMWDPRVDLNAPGKDFPCNTNIYFSCINDTLDMTVCNRSNDIVWGAYGANAVHMSVLQEFVASVVGVPVGKYYQISNNYHAYTKTSGHLINQIEYNKNYDPYTVLDIFPLMQINWSNWLGELDMFLSQPTAIGYRDPFFRRVALPIWNSFQAYKSDEKNKFQMAAQEIELCVADDWREGIKLWLATRKQNHEKREAENNAGD